MDVKQLLSKETERLVAKLPPMKRAILIWFNGEDCIEYKCFDLKPSEICIMGAVLQELSLKMMDPDNGIITASDVCNKLRTQHDMKVLE